ncbi:MAG TPA: Txe/YoeB family addiction module toxin [Anaerolineaceae bacterium]|nr:Txe/YoeB family addiction module toxin [Anaerolineaceae bacterium]
MRTKPEAVFTQNFLEDLVYWVEKQPATAARLLKLVDAVLRDPLGGAGKPEKLRYFSGNVWSRRINQEHRLVYRVLEDRIEFLQGRFHYEE